MLIYFTETHIIIGIAVLVIVLIFLRRQKKDLSYLFFFTIFWIYLMSVVSVVAFPFPIGYSNPGFKPSVNLIPFDFGRCDFEALCIRNLYENILLTVPFGFGIHFIARIRPKNILWLALAVGFAFETTQLLISLITRNSFRVIDINDLILNAVGVLLGYGVFRVFGATYSFIVQKLQFQPRHIFAYIHDIVRHQN